MRMLQNRFGSVEELIPRIGPDGGRGLGGRRPRPRITTALMSDRGVLRVLSAPAGFGKTTAMREYAEVVFDDRNVLWTSFSDPSLLCMIDEGTVGDATDLLLAFGEVAGCLLDERYLLVFDDLCVLDEKRAETFSGIVDALLAAGQEVMVATTPANDCLGALQPDRVVLDARALLVEPDEYLAGLVDGEGAGALLGSVGEGQADASFYESLGIPSLVWSAGDETVSAMVRAFFSEGLPDAYLRPAAMMLVMGSGSEGDIDAMGIDATREVRAALTLEYPLLGYNVLSGRFKTLPAAVDDIIPYVDRDLLDWSGQGSPIEVAVDRLLARDEVDRAVEVVLSTCPRDELPACICRFGWHLIELGRISCLREILDDLGPNGISRVPELILMDAWCRYLGGGHTNAACELLGNGGAGTACDALAPGKPRAAYLVLCDLIFHDPTLVGIGLGPGIDPASVIEEEYLSCSFECLAGRDDRGGTDMEGSLPCGVSAGSRCDCCGWKLILGCILDTRDRRKPAAASAGGAWEPVEQTLLRVPLRFRGYGYNLALHIALASAVERHARGDAVRGIAGSVDIAQAEADTDGVLRALLTRDVSHIIASGMVTPDRAVLVIDQVIIGAGCAEGNIDLRQLRTACTRSAGVIRSMEGFLSYLGGIAPLLSLDGHLGLPPAPVLDDQGRLVTSQRTPSATGLSDRPTPSAEETEAGIRLGGIVAAEQIPAMEVGLFGGFRLTFDGKVPPTTEWRKRNVRYLIIILTLARGNWVSRESILERLWPGVAFERARDSFYTTWRHVRQLCGSDESMDNYLTRTDICCRVETDHVDCDVFDFSAAVRESVGTPIDDPRLIDIAHRIEQLYVADLLNDDYLDGAIEGERVKLRTQFTDAMLKASAAETGHGDTPAALWFAEQAYERGETSERVYRELMAALIQEKRYAEAIRFGDECAEYLRDEIGMGFSKEMAEVYERAVYLLRHGRQRSRARNTASTSKEGARREPTHSAK